MLRLHRSERTRLCDGLSRRDFLRIGGLGTAGLTLADVLRLRAEAAVSAGQESNQVVWTLESVADARAGHRSIRRRPLGARGEGRLVRRRVRQTDDP